MKPKFRFLSRLSRVGKDKRASGPRLLARLLRDEEGAYLLIMAAAIPVFIGLAALATEGALLFYNHRNVQSAADAAAYSAAIAYSIDNSADITTQAQAIVANYGFVVGTGSGQANVVATADTTTYSPLTAINVTVTRPQLPIFSGLWVNNPFSVSGSAKAIISGGGLTGGGSGGCILSLASSGSGITLQGNPSIVDTTDTCGIFSNSSMSLGGNASITAASVGAVGSITVGGSANVGPPPAGYTQGDNTVTNPYSGITLPTPGTCLPDNTGVVTGNGNNPNKPVVTATLNPGTYCTGGISITNHATVTLNPGTYILYGPVQFIVDSQSTLTGVGVTLVFIDTGSPPSAYPHAPAGGNTPTAMNIQSGAVINLQAPAANATLGIPGMLILGSTNIPLDTAFNLQANATGTGIQGVVYLPTADLTWGGGPIVTGGCTQMITYRIIMSGNATFDNTNCNLSGGGGGGGGGGGAKIIGNIVTLVK
jgi:Flp pilus assembly protein TadG